MCVSRRHIVIYDREKSPPVSTMDWKTGEVKAVEVALPFFQTGRFDVVPIVSLDWYLIPCKYASVTVVSNRR